MGTIRVETQKWELPVDQVLREDTGDEGFSDSAFFPADEMDIGHLRWFISSRRTLEDELFF